MHRIFLFGTGFLAMAGLGALIQPPEPQEFSFNADSGLTVYGDFHDVAGERGTLLLFHQGGGNARAEYGPLIPHLTGAGYDVYAFDMPRGGSFLGGTNRTVDANGLDDSTGYCEVYSQAETALDYAVQQTGGPVVVWGSSYSAALVFQLAAKHADVVDGLLAFSPASGGPLAGCRPELYLGDLGDPAIVFRPASEMQVPSVQDQKDRFEAANIPVHVIEGGVHGSSMLNPGRSDADTGAAWQTILGFLADATGGA